ncbi:hypothetical protein BC827DRAFT_794065 [Russula dissimulans]|jgi:hypothetical protein|nr:hypothetical protein BC827DRAFT_794065 [Russula dissimulans]
MKDMSMEFGIWQKTAACRPHLRFYGAGTGRLVLYGGCNTPHVRLLASNKRYDALHILRKDGRGSDGGISRTRLSGGGGCASGGDYGIDGVNDDDGDDDDEEEGGRVQRALLCELIMNYRALKNLLKLPMNELPLALLALDVVAAPAAAVRPCDEGRARMSVARSSYVACVSRGFWPKRPNAHGAAVDVGKKEEDMATVYDAMWFGDGATGLGSDGTPSGWVGKGRLRLMREEKPHPGPYIYSR